MLFRSSNCTSLPEIAGDSGFYFPSYDAQQMANTVQNAIAQYRDDPQAAMQSRERANSFSWQATAKEYARIYKTVLERLPEHRNSELFSS